ncbi:helix-turn-helix domain-containing protein [Cellulosimicrobium sp. JZ28]|uniref:helix-turn-helix domain-containing protein n=1 Tax=Cellulosimicrobium sp. JZ28 TaxID=1906273 RepID=UPI00188B70E5|nr:helix-turn-helix domain-containing protein [Cellulosimicrobium sp. JZ28]
MAAMTQRFEWERALLASDLPGPARLVGLVLATMTDADLSIPDRFSPSLTTLAARCGQSRSTTANYLNRLEAAGWVNRARPTVEAARTEHARTGYRLRLPVPRPPASPGGGPGLVQEPDRPSPGAGHNQHHPSRCPSQDSDADASASPGDADGRDTSWSAWARDRGLDPEARTFYDVEAWLGSTGADTGDPLVMGAVEAMLTRGEHPHAVRNYALAEAVR